MSCDIHLFLEVQVAGSWKPVIIEGITGADNGCELGHYWVFCYLAGAVVRKVAARAAIVPAVPPRGLPNDLSDYVARKNGVDSWMYTLHHEGWLTGEECCSAIARAKADGCQEMEGWVALADLIEARGDQLPTRVVFWFDN